MADTIVVANAGHARTKSRSTTGCWTCRLRRKKCDEGSVECSTCVSLQLPCAGYGPRPHWMDGGENEKEKAQEIKTLVNQRRRRARPRSAGQQQATPTRTASPQASEQDLRSGSRSNSFTESYASSGSGISRIPSTPDQSSDPFHFEFAAHEGTSDLANTNPSSELLWSPITYDAMLPNSTQAELDSITDITFAMDFEQGPVQSPWSLLPEPDPSQAAGPAWEKSPWPEMDTSSVGEAHRTPTLERPLEAFVDLNTPSAVPALASPVIHFYVEHSLPAAFPYIGQELYETVRQRLLACETESTELVWPATLAYSSYLQKLGLERLGLVSDASSEEVARSQRHEILAKVKQAAMRSYREGPRQRESAADVEVALCVLPLVLLQIRQGYSIDDSLSGLMEMVVGRWRSLEAWKSPLTTFVCSVMVLLDTLRSSSTGRRPIMTGNYATAMNLDLSTIDMRQASGSESWVIRFIADINVLRGWKRDCLATQSLNVAELVKRATRLNDELRGHQDETRPAFENRSRGQDVLQITDVYAAAAQVYLHVVVSGAHPEVSDIRDAVSAAVKALKALSHAKLIRRLAWPICVAASLAEARYESFFTQLRTGLERDQEESFSVLRGLDVAQECQRLRRTSSQTNMTFDWTDAMENLPHEWILL